MCIRTTYATAFYTMWRRDRLIGAPWCEGVRYTLRVGVLFSHLAPAPLRSYGMEAVARQFATGRHVLVIRNGYFSYRWTDIFERCQIPSSHTVLKARPDGTHSTSQFSPCPIAEVVARIHKERPAVVFAPHVETSAGMILPDSYIRAVADATHSVGTCSACVVACVHARACPFLPCTGPHTHTHDSTYRLYWHWHVHTEGGWGCDGLLVCPCVRCALICGVLLLLLLLLLVARRSVRAGLRGIWLPLG